MPPISFVGRRREVAELHEALARARGGAGAVVLLAGDAGMGKTSVAQELARAAAWLGTPAVWGPAIEAEGTPPFWSWRQALTALGRLSGSTPLPDHAALEAHASRFVFFEAVVAALHRAAEPHGLLVVLDDLHWADSGSLRLLQVAAAQVPDSRLLILGTYRPPEDGGDAPLAQLLPALLRERAVTRIALGGLDVSEVEALLAHVLAVPVGASMVRRLLEQTDGNPFYLVELAEALRAGVPRQQLPASLRDIPRRRLAAVGAAARGVLGVAAVIGRDFEFAVLAAATDGPPQGLRDGLAAAAAAGLVEERGPGHHRFAHALVREALYQDLAPVARTARHARVAAAIAGLGAAGRAARIDALAHHLRRARPLSDARAALAATLEAAEAAERQRAYEHAADQYAAAVELVGEAGLADQPRAGLLLRLARCQLRAGAVATAWQASELAAAAARDEGDVRALAAAALVVRGVVDRGVARPLVDLCQEALRALNGTDAVLEARLLGQLALAEQQIGGTTAAPGRAERALAAARRTGDPEARFLALQAMEEAHPLPDQAHARLALSEEAVGVAQALGDPTAAVWAHAWRLGASWELGHRAQADAELAALTVAVERAGEPLARWRLELARATLALIDGRYSQALAAAEGALAIGERGGYGWPNGIPGVFRHLVAERTGQPTDAEAELRERMVRAPDGRLWYAQFLADQGRLADVRAVWPGGAEAGAPLPPALWLIGTMAKAKIAVALPDREWAARLYEQLLPFAALHGVLGALGGYEGPVALYCGRLAATLDRRDEAEQLFHQALAAATAMGSPPFEALARHELARSLQRRGRPRDRAAASALLEQVLVVAEHLGMRPLAETVREELERLRHPRGRASPLSDRELEVAGLVADGLTNRAIAARLHLSERTAEHHVKNILDKLGLHTRAQIAAWSAGRAGK